MGKDKYIVAFQKATSDKNITTTLKYILYVEIIAKK